MPDPPNTEFLALQEALVGRYSLEREVGRGGMGIVYLARDLRLDRPVALKLLPPALAAQPALRERFLREARTAAKLSHPNVVPIHAVDEIDDFVFFVMAYVEGGTLGQRIRERGPLPPGEATRILREVAWALAYAHAQGIVHRDVKPDNILLETGSGRALVTDFGIAQVSEGPGLTAVGEVLGTAEFMSPEQASGDTVDERSDIYSLAVVGHYMLSGQLPFQGETVAATLAMHITQAAPPLGSVAPEVPRHLAQVIDRCMVKDPEERLAGGEELAEALSRSLEERKEVPVPLRVFVKQNRERFRGFPGWVLFVLYLLTFSVVAPFVASWGRDPVVRLVIASVAGLMAAAPVGMLIRMARQLLGSGYSHQELLLALKNDLELRREELAFEVGGKPTWVDRMGHGLLLGGLTAAGAGTAALFLFDLSAISDLLVDVMFLVTIGGSVTSLLALPIAATRLGHRRGLRGERWLKFWKSRFGKLLFNLAGLGLKHVPSASATFRPTEMAIGMAADRLYEELPNEVRKSLGEVPEVVRTLETDAEKMRARVKELNEILDRVERDDALGARAGPAGLGVKDRQESLTEDLRKTRDAAEKRLAEVLAALETVRLGLLRMHAGAGSVESMTADLTSARDLSEDIARLLEGQQEVDDLLNPGTATGEVV